MELINYNDMEPLFKVAAEEAKKSLCIRRQYGAVVGYDNVVIAAHNERVTRICNNICAREVAGIRNGNHIQTELGGEIHAEAAVLIKSGGLIDQPAHFILVAFRGDTELLGNDALPCLWCAKMIKYAGYKNVFIREKNREILPRSINEIIEYLEFEYE